MKFITSDKVSLDYSDVGVGQPIVFLAGFGASKEN